MTRAGRLFVRILLITLVWTTLVASDTPARCRKRQHRQQPPPPPPPPPEAPKRFKYIRKHLHPSTPAPGATSAIDKRGVAGIPGDIEWMGFYGSLLAIPTMLSVLGIVTNYNLEKSYFNSQLNAQYYKQTREMLRAHSAKLTKEQEQKFAQAGYQWKGMIYDKDGNVRPGAQVASWHGTAVGAPGAAPPTANAAVQPAAPPATQPAAQPVVSPAAPPAANPGGGNAVSASGAVTSGAASAGRGDAVSAGEAEDASNGGDGEAGGASAGQADASGPGSKEGAAGGTATA